MEWKGNKFLGETKVMPWMHVHTAHWGFSGAHNTKLHEFSQFLCFLLCTTPTSPTAQCGRQSTGPMALSAGATTGPHGHEGSLSMALCYSNCIAPDGFQSKAERSGIQCSRASVHFLSDYLTLASSTVHWPSFSCCTEFFEELKLETASFTQPVPLNLIKEYLHL